MVSQAVLILDVHISIRNHSRNRYAAQVLDHVQPRLQNGLVSPEFIDDEPLHPRPLFFRKQGHSPVKLGKHTAAVDISHQKDRSIRHLRHAHVHDIILLQIDLRRASGALDHDDIVLLLQSPVCLFHLGNQRLFICKILFRRHRSDRYAVDDDLGTGVGSRLQQNRIHVRLRFNTGGFRLHHLGASHLQPVLRYIRV